VNDLSFASWARRRACGREQFAWRNVVVGPIFRGLLNPTA
jgi:hypothetical protein